MLLAFSLCEHSQVEEEEQALERWPGQDGNEKILFGSCPRAAKVVER